MAEQLIVKPDGTQVTVRTPDITPLMDESCQAVITTQVVICEPMSDGTWRLVTSFQDNYNLLLQSRKPNELRDEVVQHMQEIKSKWQTISLENLLSTGRNTPSSKENASS